MIFLKVLKSLKIVCELESRLGNLVPPELVIDEGMCVVNEGEIGFSLEIENEVVLVVLGQDVGRGV